MTRDTKILLGLLALAALVFSLNAGGYDLWPPDEPRYAEVAREMGETGYLVPRVNGEVYTEKPPLLFWSMAAFGALLDETNEWAARLPSILSGIYVVGLVFLLARRMFNAEVAFWAAIVLITCFRFWYQARRGQIDVLLTASMITALYAFWRWDDERKSAWLALAYTAIGAGMLAKGPPALVFPLLFLVGFYWKKPEPRKQTHWVLGSLFAIGVTLLWYVPARMYGADTAAEAVQSGMGENLFRNTLGRFLLGVSKAQPPWYYLETLPVDLIPWTFIAPPVLYWAWKSRKSSKAMWAIHSWLVPALIFFSISIGKRELYLLPLLPVFAMLFGAAIVHLRKTGNLKWLLRGGVAWSVLLTLFAVAPVALAFSPIEAQAIWRVYLLAGAGAVTGLAGMLLLLKRGGAMTPPVMAVQTLLIYSLAVFTAYPEINHFKSARPICEPVRALAEAGVDFKLYSVGFSREEYVYYARHFHTPVLTGLVGEITPDTIMEQAKLQKDARKTIAKAVDEVPVANLQHVTPEERQALFDAIESAVAGHEDEAAIRAFEADLQKAIADFINLLKEPAPAFAFIQEEDWRWLLPLYPGEIPATILVDRPVGSRHVLLLANDAATALLNPPR
ncbi:MAG: glycosyltransferase family 39 protein [Candidatus Hydrogenedentes bacterium]|nr:glycosyltransferase family 39 protein [Candidatus Hydrogenedentota bacterium]